MAGTSSQYLFWGTGAQYLEFSASSRLILALPAPGTVHITGMIRTLQSKIRLKFTPVNDPGKEIWHLTNVDTMIEYARNMPMGLK
jgi:hypothetical protein